MARHSGETAPARSSGPEQPTLPSSWLAVQTQPHRFGSETRAVLNLERQGFEAFCPRYRMSVWPADRADRPLFPRYVFARVDLDAEEWRPILGTLGVQDLVWAGDRPGVVPDSVLAEIKARCLVHRRGIIIIRPPTIPAGAPVVVTDGPFASFNGIFECEDDQQRVWVLLSLFGRECRISTSPENIRRV
jgi:transcriptional antiterminator RfaH